MRDFKKLFKITWKKYGLWVLLFSIFTALVVSLSFQDRVKYDADNIRKAVEDMAKDTNISIDTSRIDKEFIEEADKVAEAYVDKYDLMDTSYLANEDQEKFDKYYEEKLDKYGDNFYMKEEPISRYDYLRKLLTSESLDFFEDISYDEDDKYQESYAVNFVRTNQAPILIFVFIISLLITSLEQSLPSYEFSMMYPWRKRDEVWMKSILVFIFGLVIFSVINIIGAAVLKSSALGPAISFAGVGQQLFNNSLIMLATSIISVATGMIAGNFIGHLGMFLIAGGGLLIIRYIIYVLISVFNSSASLKFNMALDNFEANLPRFIKPFLFIFNTTSEISEILGYLAVALIWGLIAYAVNNKISAEKAGYMVTSTPFEWIAKIMGILSLTSLIFVILNTSLSSDPSIFINLIIYVLALLISYKLFDILFKVRLKF